MPQDLTDESQHWFKLLPDGTKLLPEPMLTQFHAPYIITREVLLSFVQVCELNK